MKARVQWLEGVPSSANSAAVMPSSWTERPRRAGAISASGRMEMLLVGLGGCTAFDVVHILEKGREPVTACDVELEAERATTDPKVSPPFTSNSSCAGAASNLRRSNAPLRCRPRNTARPRSCSARPPRSPIPGRPRTKPSRRLHEALVDRNRLDQAIDRCRLRRVRARRPPCG